MINNVVREVNIMTWRYVLSLNYSIQHFFLFSPLNIFTCYLVTYLHVHFNDKYKVNDLFSVFMCHIIVLLVLVVVSLTMTH